MRIFCQALSYQNDLLTYLLIQNEPSRDHYGKAPTKIVDVLICTAIGIILLNATLFGIGTERNGMGMTKNDISSRHFQRKISEFCELRIAPIASRRVMENIRPYLISLIIYRKSPPRLNGHIDWMTIGQACGIEAELTLELKKQLRPGLDSIIRWLEAPPAAEGRRSPKPTVSPRKTVPTKKASSVSSPSIARQSG
jgi:hypothetical protein